MAKRRNNDNSSDEPPSKRQKLPSIETFVLKKREVTSSATTCVSSSSSPTSTTSATSSSDKSSVAHQPTTVVNRKTTKYDVYIGRPGPYGNPFKMSKDCGRDEVIKKYREWLTTTKKGRAVLGRAVEELKGKALGCWCAPEACHGDVIAEFVNSPKKYEALPPLVVEDEDEDEEEEEEKPKRKKREKKEYPIPPSEHDPKTGFEIRKLEPGGYVKYLKDFLTEKEAQQLFDKIEAKVVWNQPEITIYGKKDISPQLYQKTPPMLFSDFPEILKLKTKLEKKLNFVFDYVLINKYRDGKDYIGYHTDSEHTEKGNNVIASVSLGHTRRFLVKSKDKEKESGVVEYSLTPGSLVVMGGDMQKHWKHSVPKELRVKETRINLTFRKC